MAEEPTSREPTVNQTRGYAVRRVVAAAGRGPLSAAWSLLNQAVDLCFDRRRGIEAGGLVTTESLGIAAPGNHDHVATSVVPFRRIMAGLPASAFAGSFVDLGSGMGRALVLAARYPFRRVVGVELSETLHALAVRNLAAAGLTDGGRVIAHRGDAATSSLPGDTSVLYLFNPFHGATLISVLDALQRLVVAQDRDCFLVAMNPIHLRPLVASRGWLVPVRRYRFEFEAIVYRAHPLFAATG